MEVISSILFATRYPPTSAIRHSLFTDVISRAMSHDLPTYDLFAIRYAMRPAKRSDHFIGGDPHDGPMPMDYFVWVAVSPSGTYVIDTGFTAEVAARRGRMFLRCPVEALRLVGVDPDA